MFNFEEGRPNFNSVEEVKEFLTSTDDVNVLGALCFTTPDGEVNKEVPIEQLIEDLGLDEVAKMLYDISSNSKIVAISRDEGIEILEKVKNGEELTDEEQQKYYIIQHSMDVAENDMMKKKKSLLSGLTMTLHMYEDLALFSTLGGVFTVLGNYLECATVMSDKKLSRAFCNVNTANDISNLAASKIHIDEDMSPKMAIIGLLHHLQDYAINEDIIDTPINLKGIVETFDLDEKWIFNPEEKILNSSSRIIKTINEIISENSNGSNISEAEENQEQNENGSNIKDIRERLKNRK
jgi:hypothetical protein